MESTISTISLEGYSNKSRANQLISNFENEFDGKKPEAIIRVPGRVNLIGEHIDYCGYSVLPMAIEQSIKIIASINNDKRILLTNSKR